MNVQDTEIEISDPKIYVNYLSFKFDKYKIIKENGLFYLQGENEKERSFGNPTDSDSYKILFDLLILHKNLEICGEKRIRPFTPLPKNTDSHFLMLKILLFFTIIFQGKAKIQLLKIYLQKLLLFVNMP